MDELLTLEQARALVPVDRSTFFLRVRKTVPVVRVGRRVFVRRADIERWLQDHTEHPAQAGDAHAV